MGSLSCWCIVCSMCIIFSLCMVVNSLPPPHQLDHLLRDELIQIYFKHGFSNQLILCFLVLHGIYILLSTLKRVLRRHNLKRRGSYSSLGHVGNCLLMELNESGSLLGYRAMLLKLQRKYRISIPREVVRGMLSAVDPMGVKLKRRHRLIRRAYRSNGPNYCWHIDGNDKLVTYGFSIHGCIDGFSRRILWLEVAATNKDASVIANYYLSAVEKYGCPRLLRSDRGSENAKVAFLQPFLRRNGQDGLAGENSFQYGKSVSNQRIEGWWCTLRKWCTDWWIMLFKLLKDGGHFDETDPIQVDCIRFAFMGLLQKELDDVDMWNTHLIRSTRNGAIGGIPDELYFHPAIHDMQQSCFCMKPIQAIYFSSECVGYEEYSQPFLPGDIQFCKQYAVLKPPAVCPEFLDLVAILMDENNWNIPDTCWEAVRLYLHLRNEFQ